MLVRCGSCPSFHIAFSSIPLDANSPLTTTTTSNAHACLALLLLLLSAASATVIAWCAKLIAKGATLGKQT